MTIDEIDFEEILPATPDNLFWVIRNALSSGLYHIVLMEKKSWWGFKYTKEIGFELFGTTYPYDEHTPARLAKNLLKGYTTSLKTNIVVEKH